MNRANTIKSVMLEALRRRASLERAWKGKGGLTDRDVYRSLIDAAEKHGKVRAEGIEVSISVREISRRARISYKSTLRSLNDRLIPAGLLKRSVQGWEQKAGSLILLVDHNKMDLHERSMAGVNNSNPITRFRWGAGKLGKLSGAILETIQALEPCTRPEIAKALGRKSRDIKGSLNRLVASGLVERDGEAYSLPVSFETTLEERFRLDGTTETDRKHEELYEEEREAYARQRAGGVSGEPGI